MCTLSFRARFLPGTAVPGLDSHRRPKLPPQAALAADFSLPCSLRQPLVQARDGDKTDNSNPRWWDANFGGACPLAPNPASLSIVCLYGVHPAIAPVGALIYFLNNFDAFSPLMRYNGAVHGF